MQMQGLVPLKRAQVEIYWRVSTKRRCHTGRDMAVDQTRQGRLLQ